MKALFFLFILLSLQLGADIASSLRLYDDWIESQIESRNIPGACVAVFYKDKIIWEKAYGLSRVAAKQKMTLDTLFPVSSITKPITASAIMHLWQNGKLDLDDSIDKYLVNFRIGGYSSVLPISIKELLNNTSGLPRDADFPYWNDLEFPTFHALWQKMPEQHLAYPPGKYWKYSNLGYSLLGKIVEVVSWQDYEDYIRDTIFVPLQMKNSTFQPIQEQVEKLAEGFSRPLEGLKRDLVPFYELHGLKAALGLFADLHDIAQFGLMFVNANIGPRVLEASTRRLMTKPSILVRPDLAYGLGLALRRIGTRTLIEHSGSLPGYSCYLSVDPVDHCGVVILCNCQEWLEPWVNEAARWAFAALYRPKETTWKAPQLWQKYVGKYANREGAVYVELHEKSLVLYQPLVDNMLDHLIPQADGTFLIDKGYTLNNTNGDNVSFHLAKDGTVEWMKIANMYLYPTKRQ